MKYKLRVPMLILLMISILVLVACTGKRNDEEPGLPTIDNPWWTNEGTIEKDESGNIIFDDVHIKLTSVISGYDQNGFESLIREFEQEFDNKIRITHNVYGQNDIDNIVRQQIQNNTASPDLVLTHQKTHTAFVADKLIQPIDEAYELAEIEVKKSDFLPNFADYLDLGYEGRMFTTPVDAQSIVVYYNKNILKKYGNELPKNREEFMELSKRVQAGERKSGKNTFNSIAAGLDWDFAKMYLLPTAIVQNGGSFYGSDSKANWIDGDNLKSFQNGIKAIQEFAWEGIWDMGESSDAARARFVNDNTLFFFSLPFDANVIFSAYAAKSGHSIDVVKTQDIGGFSTSRIFALEGTADDVATKIFGDSHAFMISKTVTDVVKKAAIATFVNWFTTKVNVGIEWAKLGHTSASYAIRGDASYNEDQYVKDFNNMFYEDINSFVTSGKNKYYEILFKELGTALLNCVKNTRNDQEIKQELEKAQQRVNAAIDLS